VLAAELAREFGIDASAMTYLVGLPEQRDLLERARSFVDRRVVRLALTPEGQAFAARMSAILHYRLRYACEWLVARRKAASSRT